MEAPTDTEPNRRKGLEAAIGQAEQRISRLVDQLENGGADSDISTRLHNRRNERDELKRELAVLGREAVREPPTVARINEKLAKLRDVLATDTSAGNRALRALLGQVTVSIAKAPAGSANFFEARLRSLYLMWLRQLGWVKCPPMMVPSRGKSPSISWSHRRGLILPTESKTWSMREPKTARLPRNSIAHAVGLGEH